MQRSTLAKQVPLLFCIATIAIYFYGLGHLPLIGPDEPRYAQVAREMFERRDFITPTLGGHTWFEKPALLYWMMMASYYLFGVAEWTARLGSACAGLLTILFVYLIGKRAEKADQKLKSLALWSAAALASSASLIVFARGASFDIIVTWTITGALGCFFAFESESESKKQRNWLIGFYAFIGASLLGKGLVGIVIPFGVIFLYYALRRRWMERTLIISLVWGVPLAVLLASIWYGPVIVTHGWQFIDEFFIQHHFARYLSNKYRHPQPFYFYLPVMALLALPWTIFLTTALINLKWRASFVENRFRLFALAWLVVPLAFFSLSGSKLPGYVLPALPGAMLLVGEQLMRVVRGEEKAAAPLRLTGALMLVAAVTVVIYAAHTMGMTITCALMIAAPEVLAGTYALLAKRQQQQRISVSLIIVAVFCSEIIALNCAVGRVSRRESTRDLFEMAAAQGYASTRVVQLQTIEHNSEFYAAGRILYGADGQLLNYENAQAVLEAARRAPDGTLLVITPPPYIQQFAENKNAQWQLIGVNDDVALIAVKQK